MTGDDAGFRLGREALRRVAAGGRVVVEPGLTDGEFDRIERRYGIEFADDHRGFLAAGLPVGFEGSRDARRWPDWRDDDPQRIRESLKRPVDGVLFDVEKNAFWAEAWGRRPKAAVEAIEVAGRHLLTVPAMVPVYGHRYLPAGHGTWGHPVLSMYQTDVIEYGDDLLDWVRRDIGLADADADADVEADAVRTDDARAAAGAEGGDGTGAWSTRATVPFWRDLVR